MNRRSLIPTSLCCLAALALPSYAGTAVEIVVEPGLYASGEIDAGLSQYVADLRLQGLDPILTTASFASAADLRSHLADRYNSQGLAAVVLIGDTPVEYFERANDHERYGYQRFPIDLYFQDLDGSWSDSDNNGTYDLHAGDVEPEIALGRMVTSRLTGLQPGRTEAGMLQSYFQKNHAYRTRQISLAPDGLAYIDDDWSSSPAWGEDLGRSLTGTVTTVTDKLVTTADDYEQRLGTTEYESVLICAHSDETRHSFMIGTDQKGAGGYTLNSELEDLNHQTFFYKLFACKNADYTYEGYMGGEYVFGTNLGLLAAGSTKNGGMLAFDSYYLRLGLGTTFGEAMLHWWQQRANGGFTDSEIDWHYGMTLVGDPMLKMQQFDLPEPATLAILALGGAVVICKRRRRALLQVHR
jgi:hypothetical protein